MKVRLPMTPRRLTDLQFRTLRAIVELSSKGVAPSVRELAKALGQRTTSNAARVLAELEQEGMIEQADKIAARSLRVTGRGFGFLDLPETCASNAFIPPLGTFCMAVDAPPSVNALHGVGRGKRAVYNKPEYTNWMTAAKLNIRSIYNREGRLPIEGPVAVYCHWHLADSRSDMPNYGKALYDAMEGIIFPDDKAIEREINVRRKNEPDRPFVRFWVWGLGASLS